jgi:hypothetical protein
MRNRSGQHVALHQPVIFGLQLAAGGGEFTIHHRQAISVVLLDELQSADERPSLVSELVCA